MAAGWQADAEYLAELRALAMAQANGEADTRTAQGRIQRNLTSALPEIARQGTFARKDIGAGWENRGLFRSGMRQDDIARQQYDEQKQTADLKTSSFDEVGDLETRLARLRADSTRRRTDAIYGAQQREYATTQEEALRSESARREDELAGDFRQQQQSFYQSMYGAPPAAPAAPASPLAPVRRPAYTSAPARIR